ncbi:MAG: Pr6Pr family membrane protein [Acidimicrobiia bacterium]
MTGLVFAVLLAPIEADVGILLPWVNFVLHSLAPVAVLIDWLLFPPARRLPRNLLWAWLLFPAIYLTVTLVRGPGADFYPYPFLDPRLGDGYGRVAVYALIVLLVILGVGTFVNWSAGRRGTSLPAIG